jgi:superfamily II DNA helicase RecQ
VLLWRPADAELHRRQLDVPFPPRRLLERIWYERDGAQGVPRNVLASAERLRRELHPERGPVDWRPIRERRSGAEARIQAVEDYARERGCRRARLVRYFGEHLQHCAGCDRCGTKHASVPVNPAVSERLIRLRRVLSDRKTVWSGCPVEPRVLLQLARQPPADAASLADVPGVGAALAARLGGTILRALAPGEAAVGTPEDDPALAVMTAWRAGVARKMGVPPFLVLRDEVLRDIVNARPGNRLDLARIRGVGPRLLAKFADDLLGLVRGDVPGSRESGSPR